MDVPIGRHDPQTMIWPDSIAAPFVGSHVESRCRPLAERLIPEQCQSNISSVIMLQMTYIYSATHLQHIPCILQRIYSPVHLSHQDRHFKPVQEVIADERGYQGDYVLRDVTFAKVT